MTHPTPDPPRRPDTAEPPEAPGRPAQRTLDSRELFDGGRQVVIVHGAEQYRLRLTRQGKLSLTK
jgi:hemin uptake protein HemP